MGSVDNTKSFFFDTLYLEKKAFEDACLYEHFALTFTCRHYIVLFVILKMEYFVAHKFSLIDPKPKTARCDETIAKISGGEVALNSADARIQPGYLHRKLEGSARGKYERAVAPE